MVPVPAALSPACHYPLPCRMSRRAALSFACFFNASVCLALESSPLPLPFTAYLSYLHVTLPQVVLHASFQY